MSDARQPEVRSFSFKAPLDATKCVFLVSLLTKSLMNGLKFLNTFLGIKRRGKKGYSAQGQYKEESCNTLCMKIAFNNN